MPQNGQRGIGTKGIRLLKNLAGRGRSIFSRKDALELWEGAQGSLDNLLTNLVKRGWLERLEPGRYFIIPLEAGLEGIYTEHEFVIASHLISPYCISFWSAFQYHNLTEQIPDRVYLASTKRRFRNEFEMGGVSFKIVKVPQRCFLGIEDAWIGERKVRITDKEKTLIDGFYLPQYCGGISEVVKGFRTAGDSIDLEKMTLYARKMEKGVIFKRLGMIGEFLGYPESILLKWQEQITAGINYFDPAGPKKGKQISHWMIKLNFPLEKRE